MWPNTTAPRIGAAMAEALERVNGDEPRPLSTATDGEGGNNEVTRLQAQVAHYKALANGAGDKFDQLTERLNTVTRERDELRRKADKPAVTEPKMEGTRELVLISKIIRNGGTQTRSALDEKTVESYAVAMDDGDVFPAIKVVYDGHQYLLVDGFHRVAAAEKIGRTGIFADVLQGTHRDAIWRSYSANREHDKTGLRRSNADKQKAVKAILNDPDWSKFPDREIARHVGVDGKTVAAYRKAICGNSADSTPEPPPAPSMTAPAMAHFPVQTTPPPRLVTRGGTTFPMQTNNIGKKPTTQVKRDEFSQDFPPDEPMLDAEGGDPLPFGDDTPNLPPAQPKNSPAPLPAPLPSVPQAVSEAERAAALAQRQALHNGFTDQRNLPQTVSVADPVGQTTKADYWDDVQVLRAALGKILQRLPTIFMPTADQQILAGICNEALKKTSPL